MKGPALFQGEIVMNWQKYIDEILKIFLSRTTGPISTKLGTKHPWMKGIQVCSNEKSTYAHSLNQCCDIIICVY